ncbi:MAG: S-methyl-5-thioribose-1-phosphate isomerase [Candidatus Omnitrophica bacterium]|nr:S-methyl-5-thioribose-1-phosphate isomerase [Candidatus Omnitrophota bacterium]
MNSIKFKNNRLYYLDQKELPLREVWRECRNLRDGFQATRDLQIRGAPLIGVFAAYCVCIHANNMDLKKEDFLKNLRYDIAYLKTCRPTAVNLAWALNRIEKVIEKNSKDSVQQIKQALLKEAKAIHAEDVALCERMGNFGAKLIKKGDRILTHCNTGALATSGKGTALAVVFKAKELNKDIYVYADETRPLLQGSRLTAWELMKKKIPSSVICDNTAAYLMQKNQVNKVFVGADRIASNGDTANKIGTYSIAVLSKYHKIPFYVVAPFSSFDLSIKSGKQIPIEERSGSEVKKVLNKLYVAPKAAKTISPAFDVTPHKLITAIVTDRGLVYPPYTKNIRKIFGV